MSCIYNYKCLIYISYSYIFDKMINNYDIRVRECKISKRIKFCEYILVRT